jgi:protein-S-isoprenylcysteine O-methyltransferase Ste14
MSFTFMAAADTVSRRWWPAVSEFLVRNRISISTVSFTVLMADDLFREMRPRHGWSTGDDPAGLVALALVIVGLVIRSWAAGILRKGQDLTVEGPYSLCRHPLYVGTLILIMGFCVVLGHWSDITIIGVLLVGLYWLTMRSEERRLTERYGARWTEYARRTPRLLPWKPWIYRAGEWSWSQWSKSREYQGLIGSLLVLAALEVWRRS